MGIDQISEIINKPTERGHIDYAHTTRVANTYHYWPKEEHEATQGRLPTPRVLSSIRNIQWAELEHIQNIQTPNQIAITIRAASEEVDRNRATQRQHIPQKLQTKDIAKELQAKCQPLMFADRLSKHLGPLWEEGVSDWTKILELRTTTAGQTQLLILNAATVHA